MAALHIELPFPDTGYRDWRIDTFSQHGKTYHRLWHGDRIMMLNTPEIVAGFDDFLGRAKGHILINGLGIGMCVVHLLAKASTKSLTVIEVEGDLVHLMRPLLGKDPRLDFIHADAYTYEPPAGKVYDYVWHDVWTTYSARNVKQINQLVEKYRDRCHWQDAWGRNRCEALLAQQINH